MEEVSIHLVSLRIFFLSGINHEVTPPYTPQHNGASKRKKRTIVSVMRSMSKQKEVRHYLWGEAAATATYFIGMLQRSFRIKH